MLYDCHLHTGFSGDSTALPEAQIEKAVSLGMNHICITDHHDHDVVSDVSFELDIDGYFTAMEQLKKRYKNKISISVGIELGLQVHLADYLTKLTEFYPFDFVIGSVHFIDGLDPYYPEYFKGKTEEQAYRRYFEAALENITAMSCYDSLGHLDYIVRYGENKNKEFSFDRYKDCITPILERLIRDGKALECNSGGYRNGLGAPNPCEDIMREYYRLGGRLITVGSDAHSPEYVGDNFDNVRGILVKCGFTEYAVYEGRKPRQIGL